MNLNSIKLISLLLLCIVLVLNFSACSTQTDSPQAEILRVSVQQGISDPNKLDRYFLPLLSYLEQELNIKIEWIAVKDYQEQLDKFHKGELDIALFGGYGFVKAHELDDADPLVMRDIDFRFTSYFIVAKDNKASKISELQGQSFSFGSKLSTSGHLMPRFFLSTQDIIPETFFSKVHYSGTHDRTAQWVQNGTVDAGVANSLVIEQLFKENKLSKNKVKILWKTPGYPDYVWAARKKLPEAIKSKVIEAFIKLNADNNQHGKLLELAGAEHYFPASSDDFEPIRKIALQLNMLDSNEE